MGTNKTSSKHRASSVRDNKSKHVDGAIRARINELDEKLSKGK